MSALGYVVTLIAGVTDPLRVTRLGEDVRDLDVAGPTLAAAADAILRDATGRRWPLADVEALVAVAFGGLDERGTLAITVKGGTVERFVEAAERVSA